MVGGNTHSELYPYIFFPAQSYHIPQRDKTGLFVLSKNDSHLLPLMTSLEGTRNGVGRRKLCCGSCSVRSRHFMQFCKLWEVLTEFSWAFWVMYVLWGSVIYQSFFISPFTISFYPEVLDGIGQKQKFNYLSNSFVIYNEERNFLCFFFFLLFFAFPQHLTQWQDQSVAK